jgi:hypothetical protein
LKENGQKVEGTVLAIDGGVTLSTPATKISESVNTNAGQSNATVSVTSTKHLQRAAGKIVHLLTNDNAIRSFGVQDLRSFVYKDQALKQDLQHLLDTLLNMKKKDLKKVTLFARGKGNRTVIASYVIEAPVWKTSYRLQLALTAEKSKVGAEEGAPVQEKPGWKKPEVKEDKKQLVEPGQEPLVVEGLAEGKPDRTKHWLQGWALVDNTGDEDWDRVSLTLIGGRPNSFKHDLYGPRQRKRPVLQVQEQAPPKPPVLVDVLRFHSESMLKDAPALLSSLDAGGPVIGQIPAEVKVKEKSIAEMEFTRTNAPMKQSTVRQVKPVDVFQYPIPKPVTVKRGQSALVPFLSQEFKGQACSLFNQSVNATNPLTVILFKNTTGVTLDGGPITIYDEDTCVGEAMLDSIRSGDDKFLPYGVDKTVSVNVSSEMQSALPVHKTEIHARMLTKYWWRVYERVYTFDHKGSQHIAHMYIEHRFLKGDLFELWDTMEPASKTENFWRFDIRVNAGEITVFKIKQRKLESSSEGPINNVHRDTVKSWFEQKFISKAGCDTLINDIIPNRELVEKRSLTVQNCNNQLQTTLNNQIARNNLVVGKVVNSTSYGSHNATLWQINEITEEIIANTQSLLTDEPNIRSYRTNLREAQEVFTREEAAYNSKFDKFYDEVIMNAN